MQTKGENAKIATTKFKKSKKKQAKHFKNKKLEKK